MALTTYKNVTGYVTKSNNNPKKGLIVIQEWWGLTDQIKDLADKFAAESYDNSKPSSAEGFVVVCPDLYHNKVIPYGHNDEANHEMSNLDFNVAVDEIHTWIQYLRNEQGCSSVGVTGTCMGGALSLCTASKYGAEVGACVPFYGIPNAQYFPASKIVSPTCFILGQDDDMKGFSDVETMEKYKAQIPSSTITEAFVVPGCGHAFMNSARPEVYKKDKAEVAFKKAIEFFRKHLK